MNRPADVLEQEAEQAVATPYALELRGVTKEFPGPRATVRALAGVDLAVAHGEFVAVEWQNGHPCVRLRNSLAGRDPRSASAAANSRVRGAQSIEEDVWFALDLRTVVKMVRTYTIDTRIAAAAPVASTGGQGAPRAGAAGGGRAGGGAGRAADWILPDKGGKDLKQFGGDSPRAGGAGGNPRGGQGGGAPAAAGAGAGGGAAQGGGRSGGGGGTRVVRITVEQVFELEK